MKRVITRLMVIVMGISNVFTPFSYAIDEGEYFFAEESSASDDSSDDSSDEASDEGDSSYDEDDSADEESVEQDESAESEELTDEENSEDETDSQDEEQGEESENDEETSDETPNYEDDSQNEEKTDSDTTESEISDTQETINSGNNSDENTNSNENTAEESQNPSNESNSGGGGGGGSSNTTVEESNPRHLPDNSQIGQILTGEEYTGTAIEMVDEIITENIEEIEAKRKAEIDQAWNNLNKKEISQEETYKNVVVIVEAPVRTFPAGTEIRIEPITDKKEIKVLKEELVKGTAVKTDSELLFFDISFIYKVSDGAEIKLQSKKSETVKVSFNYANNSTFSEVSNELKVYYLYEKDDKNNKDEKTYDIGEVEIDKTESIDGELVVEVENSSIYALVTPHKTTQPQDNEEENNNEEQINNEVETNNEILPQPDVSENVDSEPAQPVVQECEEHYHRNGSTCTKDTYTVTWKNEDGSVRDTTEVEYGEIPTHADANQPSDAQYTYEFKGWIPDFTKVTSDTEYIAAYTYIVNKYTVTWEDEDGTVLKIDTEVPYGTMPSYNTTPTKEGTAEYGYTFKGWTPEVSEVKGNVTYKANYTQKKNTYTVTWKNEDGSVRDTTEVEYGEIPTHEDANQPSDAQYTYEFAGWTPEISEVQGDAEYTAKYTYIVNKYTVTWKDESGLVLETDEEIEYGSIPTYDSEMPTKESSDEYTYQFVGWTPEISEVVGNMEYIAKYETREITQEEIQNSSEEITEGENNTNNQDDDTTGDEELNNNEIIDSSTLQPDQQDFSSNTENDSTLSQGEGNINTGSYAGNGYTGDSQTGALDIQEGEELEEDKGFFEGLRETLKSFFLNDEDGYLRGSETINDIVVSIEAEEGTFPAGTEVVIKGVPQDRLESIQTSLVEDENNNITEDAQIVAFDISFVYSGEEIQPEKEVSVKFNYKENSDFRGASEKELSVYHIDDETDKGTEIQVASKDGDEIEILATDFSIYVLTLSNDNSITLTLDPGDGIISSGSNIVVNGSGIGTITSVDGNVTLPNATRANYVFVGWYTGQTTSLQNFAGIGGDQYHVDSNITLYAKWCNRGSTMSVDKTTCISSWNSKTIMDQNPNFTYGEIEIQRPAGLTDADGPASITIMDRNLGASSAGTSNSAWGYYYQYGNNYGFVENPPTIVRNVANVNLTLYGPGNPYYSGNFVIGKVGNTKHNNWPTTANYNIWGFESSIEEDRQGPCPFGRHIPTIEEWNKVVDYRTGTNGGMNVNNFRTQLGLPLPGGIMRSDAKMEGKGSSGWFTTVSLDLSKEFVYQLAVTSTSYTRGYSENMVNARQIRCFKNEDKSDVRYTVIYKDGEDEEAFEDQIFSGLSLGDDFPEFSGNISSRIGENDSLYEFSGWHLSGSDVPFDVSTAIVRYDTILYAKWNEIHRYTVIYTDGKDDMEIFEDQIFSGLLEGGDFPEFSGNIPSRTGENDRVHDFAGWYLSGTDISFDVSGATVTENIILKAKWTGCPDGEDENAHGECVPTADKQRELQIVQDLDVYFLASDTDKKHYTLMDRNMGAAGVYNKNYGSPNSVSFGYFYQWGNNYGFPARGDLAQQGVSTTTSQVPKSVWSKGIPSRYSSMAYYLNSNKDGSWMAGGSKTDGIWGGTGDTTSVEGANTTLEGRQGPCPAGYHVPSSVEIVTIFTNWSGVSVYTSWNGTGATSAAVIFSEDFLLPPAGRRAASGAVGLEVAMSYWSSSPHPTKGVERALGFYWNPTDDGLKRQNDDGRLRGRPVRCVKNTVNTSTTAIATQDIHLNGGENAVISIDNGVISSLRSPTRIDSTFEGWYTSSDFSGNPLSTGDTVSAGSSLYAKFTCNESGYVWNGTTCENGVRLYFDSMGGTEVSSQLIKSGTTGVRPADPTKTGYAFSGWYLTGETENEFNFTGTIITESTTLYAHWNTGQYEVSIVSNNEDYGTVDSGSIIADFGTPISTNENELTIGSTIITATPASSGAEYTYIFSGWNNTCGNTLTGNCTITAEFNRITNGYTIIWKNSDGSVLETDTGVVYGATPNYDGATPTSGGDVQYSYTFDTWIPAISAVIGDAEYIATYTQSVNVYTATIVASPEGYGTVDSGSVPADYGTSISTNGNELTIGSTIVTATPTTDGLGYTYTFTGWTFNNCGSEGNHEMRPNCKITANFERTLNEYTVTILSSDINSGTVTTGSITVPYGTSISKSGNIVIIGSETSTANPNPQTWQYDFNFVNWTDTCGETVTTGCEVTANFESLLRTYTLDLVINTGIETIYYKINGADSFTSTGVTTTISGVEAGSEILAYAEAKSGYTHIDTSLASPWNVTVTGDNIFSPIAMAGTGTEYTVYHYVKIAGQSGYLLSKTEILTGATDEILVLSSLAKESEFLCAHYSSGSLTGTDLGPGEIVTETTIKGDGSTEIYLYYIRQARRVTLSGDEHIDYLEIGGETREGGDEAIRTCGSEVPVNAIPKAGYHFVRWDKEERERREESEEQDGENLI